MKCITRTASVILCSFLFSVSGDATESPYVQSDSDPMQALNIFFRTAYAHARQDVLEHSGPIIVATGNQPFSSIRVSAPPARRLIVPTTT